MRLKYYSRLTCKLIFLLFSFNVCASDDSVSIGVNTGVYSDSSNEESDDQFAYSRLLFGYNWNDFGGRVSLTKSSENDLSPYLGFDALYDFKVSKNYVLRPIVGVNFVDNDVEPDLGLELHYLISRNMHFVISNNYRLANDPEYFFGLGFEYRFLSKTPDQTRSEKLPLESVSEIPSDFRNECHANSSLAFTVKDAEKINVWDKVYIVIKNKFLAKLPIDSERDSIAILKGKIPEGDGSITFELFGHNDHGPLYSKVKPMDSLPTSKCNRYSINVIDSKTIEIDSD